MDQPNLKWGQILKKKYGFIGRLPQDLGKCPIIGLFWSFPYQGGNPGPLAETLIEPIGFRGQYAQKEDKK